jgi:hypothetical protein
MNLDEVKVSAQGNRVLVSAGTEEFVLSLFAARMLSTGLTTAISECILPTPAFYWDEPTPAFKLSARLCGPSVQKPPQPKPPNPNSGEPEWVKAEAETKYRRLLDLLSNPATVGYVLQENENRGGEIPQGYYIAAAAPDWSQVGYRDFEDAQAAVAQKIRGH